MVQYYDNETSMEVDSNPGDGEAGSESGWVTERDEGRALAVDEDEGEEEQEEEEEEEEEEEVEGNSFSTAGRTPARASAQAHHRRCTSPTPITIRDR